MQLEWLARQQIDALILTECRDSQASRQIVREFVSQGLHVRFRLPESGDYGALLASRHQFEQSAFESQIEYLGPRVVSAYFPHHVVEIVGVYVPSRGFDTGPRLAKKKQFLDVLATALLSPLHQGAPRVLCGDLNVLERDHVPSYKYFQEWEYSFYERFEILGYRDAFRSKYPDRREHSWLGRGGAGYRYDHAFIPKQLAKVPFDCFYLHEPRELRLSDHSALILEWEVRNPLRKRRLSPVTFKTRQK